ncbi:MAG TPA: hypothetical protein VMA77_26030 [Solirubrobacteraceae bacterium]|nr:hypothetical protein [Solirubrobacteraceae bacterium]
MFVAGLAAYAAHQALTQPPTTTTLPPTPTGWLAAYNGATTDRTNQACKRLLSPQLAATYSHAPDGSCTIAGIRRTDLRIHRLIQNSDTAVLELHPPTGPLNVVLGHTDQGWQAIDIVPGRPRL